MKIAFLITLTALALSAITSHAQATPADVQEQQRADVGDARFTAMNYKPGTVRHIVLFRYKSSITVTERAEVRRRFMALADSERNGAKYIVSIEAGNETSGEGADQNLEEGFIVTFRSLGDRNFYVGQPVVADARYYDANHQAFKDFVGPLLDTGGALVFDFQVGR